MVERGAHCIRKFGAAEDDERRWRHCGRGFRRDAADLALCHQREPGRRWRRVPIATVHAVLASVDFEIGFGKAREIAIRESCCPEFRFHAWDKRVREPGRGEIMPDDIDENETLNR